MTEPKKDGDKRDRRGRFADGNAGGPGRPKGKGRGDLLRDALGDDLRLIFDKLREQALAGDTQAIRLIVDKIIPSRKPVEEPVTLEMPEAATLTEIGHLILRAVADGDVAPSQGSALIGALGGLARVVEVDEMERRIAALEAANEKS